MKCTGTKVLYRLVHLWYKHANVKCLNEYAIRSITFDLSLCISHVHTCQIGALYTFMDKTLSVVMCVLWVIIIITIKELFSCFNKASFAMNMRILNGEFLYMRNFRMTFLEYRTCYASPYIPEIKTKFNSMKSVTEIHRLVNRCSQFFPLRIFSLEKSN